MKELITIENENRGLREQGRTVDDLLSLFVESQDVRDSSKRLYKRVIRLFIEWVENEGKDLERLNRNDLLRYKESLFDKGLSPLSVSSYLTALRRFYEWLESEKIYPNIAKGIKTPRRKQAFKKQHLSETKSKELLKHFEAISLRDFAIVNLLLRTGLRTIEIIRANVEDITFKGERRILKVHGKGKDDKSDFVILSEKAYEPIKAYLNTRKGLIAGEPLFTSSSKRNGGERLTTRSISRIVKDGLISIGLDGKEFTAHSLRHTTAVTILKHTGDISQAQTVLRHANPATTQIYTESIKDELRLERATELIIDDIF